VIETPLFRFEDVCLQIGDAQVLDHLSIEVPDHRVTVVLGPSGAGKSTLLRMCNRLEAPTSGRVLFRGADVAEQDPLALRRRVGMVFQRPTPFPGTVRDNLGVAAPDSDDPTFLGLLDQSGLPREFLDRGTDGLSGGEAQRVCLARALAAGPEVLLLDEPTASLDPENRSLIEDLALGLADRDLPIIWVTHDLRQARRLVAPRGGRAGREIVLVEGRVATDDEDTAFRRGDEVTEGEPP
jgi:putative ABC transport system ATP-binding protein